MTASPRPFVGVLLVTLFGCAPGRYQPPKTDYQLLPPAGAATIDASLPPVPGAADAEPPPADALAADTPAADSVQLHDVVQSVLRRYPPMLQKLLERDLASGRLLQAMGGFDTRAAARVGGRVDGYYDSTVAYGLLEQPLATGDTLYGGYRISDGLLPDYDKDRTQDDGEFVFGGRFPLLQNRSIDPRRADVRLAEIGVELAEPKIQEARIEYVRKASGAFHKWVAAGQKLGIARELLQLAQDRDAGLRRAVERQFLAPIALTDNERLVAQRRIQVARSERVFQQAALVLSLFLRGDDDRPLVATERHLPDAAQPLPDEPAPLDSALQLAARQRPDLHALQLEIDKTETERDLADNQTLPYLDLIVEGARSLSDGPYTDREELELFVGGELKMPVQRRAARGKLRQATAKLHVLRLEQQFARDRITNELLDARSAMDAARRQLQDTQRNVELATQLVAAEQRAFDLGRSDLLRIQLREVTLADARAAAIDARLGLLLAHTDYRAALGFGDAP